MMKTCPSAAAILVNGTPEAWFSVDRGLYRFRLLNGSNARIYKVALSDGRAFHLIGTDGGLLPTPVSVSSLMLAPGQRLEILVDFSVPFGDLEIWEYRNTSMQFHPMHAHAAFCQVMSRSCVAQLPPEDAGWKDTVLVNPNERVRVLTRFDTHPGVFVHHCHNLEHEDAGMMQNFAANQFFHEDFRGAPSVLV